MVTFQIVSRASPYLAILAHCNTVWSATDPPLRVQSLDCKWWMGRGNARVSWEASADADLVEALEDMEDIEETETEDDGEVEELHVRERRPGQR
jgi:hypothetical protein